MSPKISVILPTYNERENIVKLIATLKKIIAEPLEIIVVDDNSPDCTWKVVEELAKNDPTLKLIKRLKEKGLATAISEGSLAATGDIIVWMDSDFSHPPELLSKMIEDIKGYDMVIASRFVKDGGMNYSLTRILTSRLVNFFAGILLGFSVKDYTSGYAAIRSKMLEKIMVEPVGMGYGEYFISFVYKARKAAFKIKEIPYTYMPRKLGVTKTSPNFLTLIRLGLSYGLAIISLKLGLA